MTNLDPKSRAAAKGLSDLTIRNLFIIPTIAFLIIFNIFPLLYSLAYSFTDFRASTNAPANFVGLQNYRDLLNDPTLEQLVATGFVNGWPGYPDEAMFLVYGAVGLTKFTLAPGGGLSVIWAHNGEV